MKSTNNTQTDGKEVKNKILERISVCNEDIRKQELYNVVLKITQKGT